VARRILAAGFVHLLLLGGQARAARLIVTIEGTRDADGYLCVALYAKPDGFPEGDYSVRHMKLKAAPKPLTVVFDDLAPAPMRLAPTTTKTITAGSTPIYRVFNGRIRAVEWYPSCIQRS
jgi:uncharacterized protein (DUF2141 family)